MRKVEESLRIGTSQQDESSTPETQTLLAVIIDTNMELAGLVFVLLSK
jgi:hypothetical protein